MTPIPDDVGREACRLLTNELKHGSFTWPRDRHNPAVIAIAKLLMNPPAPMTDPDEEAAKRVLDRVAPLGEYTACQIAAAKDQMRKEFAARKEAWEAGRS